MTSSMIERSGAKVTGDMQDALEIVNLRFAPMFLEFDYKTNADNELVMVHRRAGPNASDKKPLGPGISIRPTDVVKFVETHATGADNIIGALDGTSWQVKADDVCRDFYEDGGKVPDGLDMLADRIWARVQGIRGTRGPRTHALPDGTRYAGNDLTEFRQAYIAALVDQGVSAEIAQAIGSKITF